MNTLPPEFALSRAQGAASGVKDFAWLKENIPCQAACPAGTDIPGYLDAISQGDYQAAYEINLRDNVFPAVLGRVCTRPCEPACRHGWEGLGDPVAICFSKRSAEAFMHSRRPVVLEPWFSSTGKRIAVVGAGVAGLTAARDLALFGHQVVVYERHQKPGGMLVLGIPGFRLPRDLVRKEIEQVTAVGVDICCGVDVGADFPLENMVDDFDAVILAAGTHRPYTPDLPGLEFDGVMHGLPFLQRVNAGKSVNVGLQVVVVGGGFTAVDCARTAWRLKAGEVTMLYRRSGDEMYITPGEIEAMAEEGITFETQAMPVRILGEGAVRAVEFIRTDLGEPDASGRRCPVPRAGSEFSVAADTVLMATGQTREREWIGRVLDGQLMEDDESFPLPDTCRTAHPKVFVAGDFATGAISLIDAIGHARACARVIDVELMGEDRVTEIAWIEEAAETGRTRAMDAIPRQPMPALPVTERILPAEVDTGYTDDTARAEAKRCYLCHYKYEIDNDLCIYCDRCLKVKPVESCIVKASELVLEDDGRISGVVPSTSNRDYNLLYIDQNECIRCGACADVCPVECITLQKVSLKTVRSCDLVG